jgi:hypothetical protein
VQKKKKNPADARRGILREIHIMRPGSNLDRRFDVQGRQAKLVPDPGPGKTNTRMQLCKTLSND